MGAEWVRQRVASGKAKRIIIAGPTSDDIRDIMIEGESGIFAISPPWDKPRYHRNQGKLAWANGATALCITAEKPDRFRGKQCDTFWADELASWRYPDAWTQLQLGFRLGDPKGIVTTTPRPTQLIKALVARAGQDVVLTRGTTYENRANLAEQFFAQVIREYEGTRLGRQELQAEILEDNPNALWNRTRIDELRVVSRADLPAMKRVVVAVDPAVSTNPRSNETGIVVVGLGTDGHAYVLDDMSGIYSPAQWASRILLAFDRWQGDYVVGEVNNGGDLVERNVQVERDDPPPFRSVHASRGKQVRADPVASLYEQGRVHHLGSLARLEDQMCAWDPANDASSPDRVDVLVWGITFLDINKKQQTYDGIRHGHQTARGR
jgi:phage terminase large subunit-like protein